LEILIGIKFLSVKRYPPIYIIKASKSLEFLDASFSVFVQGGNGSRGKGPWGGGGGGGGFKKYILVFSDPKKKA
jgi:hypothetical protein